MPKNLKPNELAAVLVEASGDVVQFAGYLKPEEYDRIATLLAELCLLVRQAADRKARRGARRGGLG